MDFKRGINLSSLAQDESRSISENVTWSVRKRVQEGKVSLAYSTFLGYDKGEDGKLKVNEEQAETIKLIFRLFMIGYSAYHIKEKLEELKIKTPFGKTKWHVTTIQNILCNEKYKGDALLQKTYTVDFLTKKTKKNEGELPQVYVENAHDAIIDKKAFDLVQIEAERRKGIKHYSGISIFSGKVYCGECGAFFGRKVWHSNDKYKKIVYRCNHKYDGEEIDSDKISTNKISTIGKSGKVCTTGIITEEEIKELFVKEYNKLDVSKAIKNAKKTIKDLTNTDSLDNKLKEENEKATSLVNQINELIDKNSRVAMDQDEFKKEKERLSDLYNSQKKSIDELTKEIEARKARRVVLESFITNIENAHKIKEFDEGLFCALVDKIIVYKDRAEIRWKGMG